MNTRREFLKLTGLSALALGFPRLGKAAAVRPPNIVFFLVDDMGWMDCGAYGSQYYETPNMDRFAKRAMRFTDAYAQPLCSPTRASLLSGQYSARHGITSATGHQPPQPAGFKFLPDTAPANQPMLTPHSKNFLEPSQYTLAEALHDAGYRTAHIGKWHLGLTPPHWPEQQGFDVTFHCHPDPGPPGEYFSPYGVKPTGTPKGNKERVGNITDGPPGEYIVDRLANEAIKFIETSQDRPFYLNLWNYGVHGPWGHKEAYTKVFAAKQDPRGVQGNAIMASMLKSVDECFGRILEKLEQLGLTENTIVVFNSDNGGNTHSNTAEDGKVERRKPDDSFILGWRKWAGNRPPTNNHPLRDGKGTLYEGGTRVPLMWAWPGHIKPGTTSDAVVGHIDLYPTLLEMAGLPRPAQQKIDGVSYAAVLKQTGTLDRKAFFNYFPHAGIDRAGGVSARSGDWKLIRWFAPPPGDARRYELYNLREDLGETKNLAAAQPALVKELDALIDGFLADTGATYPRPNPACKVEPADPLLNWKPRQCEAVVKNGALVLTLTGKPGTAFLGYATRDAHGPVALKLRVRTSGGGAGRVDCFPKGSKDESNKQSFAFVVPAGEGQEVAIAIPLAGALGTLRLYLPVTAQPMEVDWIEMTGAKTKSQRWDFGAK